MNESLLHKIVRGMPTVWSEEPDRIWLGVRGSGMGHSNTLAGIVYTIVSEYGLKNAELRVNGEWVAKGRLEIFFWVLENAPITLRNAVHILIKHEEAECSSSESTGTKD